MAHLKKRLNTFHLFAGAGGGILGDLLLGHNPIGWTDLKPLETDKWHLVQPQLSVFSQKD